MTKQYTFFATAPKGMEPLLADELRALGASAVAETRAGVSFEGSLSLAYRVCLWSRIANRVLLPLATFAAPTPEDLYAGVRTIRWDEHLGVGNTLAVDFSASNSQITHTHYGALKVKDAIVDQFRDATGERPSVARECPDVRINLYLLRDVATINIDLAGESLHRRGYRALGVEAPLKENLAAAILLRAGWPDIARAGGALLDPMCGSGTLPIEAALIAADIAPGLLRGYYGFLNWRQYDAAAWATLMAEATQRKAAGMVHLPPIVGYDADPRAVRLALANVEAAGLHGHIHIERRELAHVESLRSTAPGLVAVNPPYGERLGEVTELQHLYKALGDKLKEHFVTWKAVVITGNAELGKCIGVRARRMHTLYNGAIECKLLSFDIDPQWYMGHYGRSRHPAPSDVQEGTSVARSTTAWMQEVEQRKEQLPRMPEATDTSASLAPAKNVASTAAAETLRQAGDEPSSQPIAPSSRVGVEISSAGTGLSSSGTGILNVDAKILSPGAEMFANRLRKNLKTLGKWAQREGVYCYRVYDADLPEYALAVDIYEQWVHVQEYQAPRTIDPAKAATRLHEAMAVLPSILGIADAQGHANAVGGRMPGAAKERIFLKVRRQQKGNAQYEKQDELGTLHEVREANCKFLVNFTDYLDTGLFLDHRPTRALIQQLAKGKRFLNLFAYTGTATVHAVVGGAAATTTVDMSATYLAWARRNLALNGFSDRRHEYIQADCLVWMDNEKRRFDLIFLDPPTFSNSKRMDYTLDVQRDHVALIQSAVKLLDRGGVLLFSNNYRNFKIDQPGLTGLVLQDLSRATLPKDFERDPKIHNCWKVTRPEPDPVP